MFWMILAVIALLMLMNSPLGEALAARIERSGNRELEKVLAERVAFLEGEVERLSSELRRLDEESDFLQKLLAERPAGKDLPPGDAPD